VADSHHRPRAIAWTRDLSPPPEDPRRDALTRLLDLEDRGILSDVSVGLWGKAVLASGNGASDHTGIRDRVAEFYRWAERTGHSLEPAFERSEVSTMVSADFVEVVRLPLQCVELREGDDLVAVFPCTAEGETQTVGDCVDILETDMDVGGSTTDANRLTLG
jgi:hypothetical protein